jgi:hypothetical protein
MKKILLAIGIFSINYSAITQSNSCSISVNNIQDNTICDFGMSPNGYNGFCEVIFIDTVGIGSNISFQCISSNGNPYGGAVIQSSFGTNASGVDIGVIDFSNLVSDTYNVIINNDDGNGYTCSASTSVTIGDNSTSNITVTAPGSPSWSSPPINGPSCENLSNGFIEVNVDYGQPPYNFTVDGNFTFASGTSYTDNFFINNLPSGSFDITVYDDNYCGNTFPAAIVPPSPSLSTSHDTICFGDTVTLDIFDNNNGGYNPTIWHDDSTNNLINYTFSPSQSGYYSVTIGLDTNGHIYNTCYDSVYIEVLNNSIFSEVLTLCDSIVWNGVTYDSSGVYSDTLQNSLGCDSILILDVTFAQPTYGIETLTACDSVIWNGITYDSSGTFIDTIPNHLGCDSIVTIDVNLVGDYDMRFLVSPVSLIAPPFIFPFINATPNLVNYDFTWDFGDGTVIATNDTNITHEYQYNGVYTVKLIAEDMVNNCGVDTLEKVNLINCSGGPSLSIEEAYNNLVLYPNPARYVLNIDYGTEKDYSNHIVEIVNGIGQVVFTNMMNSSKTQISVSELGAKGLYFINIKDSNNKILVTKHLIVN